MFDDAKHDDVEPLFEEEANEINEDPADQPSTTDNGEERQDTILSPREEAKEKQVRSWASKVLAGEKSIDDIPADKKWLKNLVSERINETKPQEDIEKLVDKKIQEREAEKAKVEADKRFLELKAEISTLELEADEKEIIEAKYKNLLKKGLDKLSALEEAKSYFDLIKEQSESKIEALRERMGLPKVRNTSKVKVEKEIDDPDFFNGSSKDRIAYYEKVRSTR